MPKKPAESNTSSARLAQNNYGKSRVRLVKVERDPRTRRHDVHELNVDVALEGDFDAIHTRGDNANCLPTDTMKNTVYALAKGQAVVPIEAFALALTRHFLGQASCIASARVRIARVPWDRVTLSERGGRLREHPHCFLKGSDERATCDVTRSRRGVEIASGVQGLVILKSTDSAFSGYMKDQYTTLPETRDRIFATSLTATWRYASARPERVDFDAARDAIRAALVRTFVQHKSESVQHTLFAMGEAALKACRAIDSIRLSMPNKHCLLVNLAPFGLTNENEVFVPTDEPHGLIEATVERR